MDRVICIFSDNNNFHKSKLRLAEQAIASGFFTKTILFSEADIPPNIIPFCQSITRGFGWYIWKPFLISKAIRQLNYGDILFYLDAGCSINPLGTSRFIDYIQMLTSHNTQLPILGFQLDEGMTIPYKEKYWCKKSVFESMGAHEHKESGAIMAGIMGIKITPITEKFIEKWGGIIYNNPQLIYDTTAPNADEPQDNDFISHRNEQPIFSLLMKQHGGDLLLSANEVLPELHKNKTFDMKKFPIIATRTSDKLIDFAAQHHLLFN